jgi:hypothetical protein
MLKTKHIVEVSLFLGTALWCSASTINGGATASPSFTYTGTGSNNNMSGSDLNGATVLVTFDNGAQEGCVFLSTAVCAGADFTALVNPASSQTNSATWEIFNDKLTGGAVGTNITSVLYDLSTVSTSQGKDTYHGASFFPCVDGAGVPTSGGCAGGFTARSVSAGNAALAANAAYFNGVAPPSTPYTYYTQLLLTFTTQFSGGCATTPCSTGNEFGFQTSSILWATLAPDAEPVPEPATYSMVGLAFLGLGALKFKRTKARR